DPEHPVEIVAREKAAGAVVMASRNMVDVTVKVGFGQVKGVAYNRRKRVPGGVVTMTCDEFNFDTSTTNFYKSLGVDRSQVQGAPDDPRPTDGPVDEQLTLLLFEGNDGNAVA